MPTPVVAHGLVFISGFHGRVSPVYAVRLDARGDVSLRWGAGANEYVVWSDPRRGGFTTPLVYGDYLYVLSGNGILTCFEARTGRQVYRERLAGRRGTYTASPVAAAGKLYLTSGEGEVHVVRAGPEYEHLATNRAGGYVLATPAISGDLLLVRTTENLVAIGG